MNFARAFAAGVLGGLAMTIVLAISYLLIEMPFNLEATLGSIFGLDPTAASTWLFGFVLHLIISGLIGLLYGLGFQKAPYRAGAELGLSFALFHVIIGGLMLALLPIIHPLIPQVLIAPGIFMSNLGAPGIVIFLMIHMIYGAIVGGVYAGQPVQSYREPLPA